jgi:Sulfatase
VFWMMPGENTHGRGGPAGALRSAVRILLLFYAFNVVLFLLWRLAFLAAYVPNAEGAAGRVLIAGFRLDLALLGMEAAVVLGITACSLSLRPRLILTTVLVLTVLNLMFGLADFFFYGERNQHMGELFLANISDLPVLLSEIVAFIRTKPLSALLFFGLIGALGFAGRFAVRRVAAAPISLLRPPWRLLLLLLVGAALFFTAREPVTSKARRGYTFEWASSRHYANLNSFLLHQAIPNPLGEILMVHVRRMFTPAPKPRLDPEGAMAICRTRLPGLPVSEDYPLLVELLKGPDLGIENVFVIVVEGLSASVLEHSAEGREVMPGLADLARRGIYFPNTIQSFNNTAGGVFCVTTSLPRTCLEERRPRIFTQRELDSTYGSLPRLLEDTHTGTFFAGYRQSHFVYTAFLGNQGFRAWGFPDFHERLLEEGRAEESESILGVMDGPFLKIAARELLESERPFAAQAMTASTHSPWTVPEDFPHRFESEKLTAYRYADESIVECLAAFKAHPKIYEKTLFVILADHTSLTFGDGQLERMRIPMIFFNPKFEAAGLAGRRDFLASQTDVTPTALHLMGGGQRYAGLGRNLLDPKRPDGVISGTRNEGYYFRGGYALRWRLVPEELALFEVKDGEIGTEDLSRSRPSAFQEMVQEYFAQYETSDRLARTRSVVPLK